MSRISHMKVIIYLEDLVWVWAWRMLIHYYNWIINLLIFKSLSRFELGTFRSWSRWYTNVPSCFSESKEERKVVRNKYKEGYIWKGWPKKTATNLVKIKSATKFTIKAGALLTLLSNREVWNIYWILFGLQDQFNFFIA